MDSFVSPAVITVSRDGLIKIVLYFQKTNETKIHVRTHGRANVRIIKKYAKKNGVEFRGTKRDFGYAYGLIILDEGTKLFVELQSRGSVYRILQFPKKLLWSGRHSFTVSGRIDTRM